MFDTHVIINCFHLSPRAPYLPSSIMNTRTLLKDARQCLESADYERSIELCEAILKQETDHYTALLLLGAAATASANSGVSYLLINLFRNRFI